MATGPWFAGHCSVAGARWSHPIIGARGLRGQDSGQHNHPRCRGLALAKGCQAGLAGRLVMLLMVTLAARRGGSRAVLALRHVRTRLMLVGLALGRGDRARGHVHREEKHQRGEGDQPVQRPPVASGHRTSSHGQDPKPVTRVNRKSHNRVRARSPDPGRWCSRHSAATVRSGRFPPRCLLRCSSKANAAWPDHGPLSVSREYHGGSSKHFPFDWRR